MRRKVKKSITLDRDLLEELQEVARAERLAVSTFLNRVLHQFLEERKRKRERASNEQEPGGEKVDPAGEAGSTPISPPIGGGNAHEKCSLIGG